MSKRRPPVSQSPVFRQALHSAGRRQTPLQKMIARGEAYARVYASPDGREVFDDLLREAGVLEVSTVAGDPYMTHFNDGKKAIGLYIFAQMRWSAGELRELAAAQTQRQVEAVAEGADDQ